MPTVYVNDMPVEIGSARLNCVQAAELANLLIPHYCYHEALTVVASCRMCLIEMGELKDGKVTMIPKVFPGCQTPVKDGTVIVTGDYEKRDRSLSPLPYDANYRPGEKAKKAQADTLEGLLINHPLDCPVCDKAGECKLQDYSFDYGRSESRMVDQKNTPPNKPELSSKITLFTDRCIMCTRCVRFTREISGTAELMVSGRGHHEEIDVFPGRPLENKLSGNVVDLCPVGALGSKDFLYTQRVWYLKTTDGVCGTCSTGCSTHVDSNKDIVYRIRARVNPQAQGHFMCDDGRDAIHPLGERILRPTIDGKATPWHELLPKLKQRLAAVSDLTVILSPFLTVEEAFLYATAVKAISKNVRLVLGPVPVVGEDDAYPKDVKGNAVSPPKFVIRAEKCPNRSGVQAVIEHFQSSSATASNAVPSEAVFFVGGYPNPEWSENALKAIGPVPKLLIVQDLFASPLTQAASIVLPATNTYEKDGTFVNHAGFAQTFPRAVRPAPEVRSELQVASDLLDRRGLVQPAAVRKELAAMMPQFAELAHTPTPTNKKVELATV